MFKLRELEKKDMAIINTWRNNPAIIDCLGAPYRFINKEVDDKWFDSYMVSRNNAIRCVILSNEDKVIGLVSLTNIDYIHRKTDFHIMIGDSAYHNKGAGTFALEQMICHAFKNMNLNRIELDVLATNQKAIGLYEKMGFVKEGVLRQAVYKNGSYVDMIHYSLLKNEWGINIRLQYEDLPVYSINIAVLAHEKRSAILICKDAFLDRYNEILNDPKLLDKIRASADVLIAMNKEILGYCAIYANNSISQEGYITLIAVRPAFQNQHIGKALISAAESLCLERGMTKMRLEVRHDNENAISFYLKNGFQKEQKCSEVSYYMTKRLCCNKYSCF